MNEVSNGLKQGSETSNERKLRLLKRGGLRVLGVTGLAGVAHLSGVSATQLFPAHVETNNYAADVSLGYKFDEIAVESPFGGLNIGYDSALPTQSVEVQPSVKPELIGSFQKDGVEGLSLTEEQTKEIIHDLVEQLGARYASGVLAILGIIGGSYGYALGREAQNNSEGVLNKFPKKASITALTAAALATGYQSASAYSTYAMNQPESYTVDGLAKSLQLDEQNVINGLGERSDQMQRYLSSWAALRKDVSNVVGPETLAENGDGPSFLLVSDIHGVDMYDSIRTLAQDTDAVIDTGDMLNFGRVEEGQRADIFKGIESIKKPYIFVLGNHDKSSRYDTALIRRLEKIPNVVVLQPNESEYNIANFGELRIAGANDTERWYGDKDLNTDELQKPVKDHFNKTFENNPPDIALSHEPAAASGLASRSIRISGHAHVDEVKGKTITMGSFSGGGLFGQRDDAQEPTQSYGVLRFDALCQARELTITKFNGMYSGKIDIESQSTYFFESEIDKDEPARNCKDTSLFVSTRSAPKITSSALKNIQGNLIP